jgi:hypothetical protein
MNNKDDDKELPRELFGTVKQLPKVGGLQPDITQIQSDLSQRPEYLCALFCSGCGFEQGLTAKGAKSFSEDYELPPLDDKTLIVVEGCQYCNEKKGEFQNPRVITIE